MPSFYNSIKKLIDFFISLFGIVILSPIMIVVAIIIKLDSPGPIFFKQLRVGIMEKNFKIYKFRTMVVSNLSSGEIIPGSSAADSRNEYQTTVENDPRITKFGYFLRKYHLDELPQLFNVLKGEMSLIGPRPYTPSEIVDYKKKYWKIRHLVKPGITGAAQIYLFSRKNKTYSRIALDVFYIKKRSLAIDFIIFINTLIKTIKGNSF